MTTQPTQPVESLELRALEQRNRLHNTATDLRNKVSAAREKLDMSKNIREHLIGASIIVSLVGFFSGYGVAGIFADH
jgi:hypothetical protein